MTEQPTGRLSGTRERPVVEHRRRYSATAAQLWAAWTRPDQLARWLAAVDEGRVAEGEKLSVRLRTGPTPVHPATWVVRAAREPQYLELEWDDGQDVGGTLAVTLTPDGPEHTFLQLRHAPAASPSALGRAPTMAAGWDGFLTGLAVLLAGGDDDAVAPAGMARFEGTQGFYRELAAGIAND